MTKKLFLLLIWLNEQRENYETIMIDQKIISKLQNYYFSNATFRYACLNSAHYCISSSDFLSTFALYSDLQITRENLFCFLIGIKNSIDLYDDSEFLSNLYYSTGKKIDQMHREKTYTSNISFFSQHLVYDISNYNNDDSKQKLKFLKTYNILDNIIKENKTNINYKTLKEVEQTLELAKKMMSEKGWI